MHFIFSFFLFFSFFCSAWCKEALDLSAFEGDPAGIVYDSVDVLSGSYLALEIDAIIAAPTPIVLKRSYTSKRGLWQHFPECHLVIGKEGKNTYAIASESSGTPIVYAQCEQNASRFLPDFKNHNKGIVNTAKDAIGASNNLKNNSLIKVANGYELTLSSGVVRLYKKISQKEKEREKELGFLCQVQPCLEMRELQFFHLVLETLPSGNKMRYHYDKEGRLEEICAVNTSEKKQFCAVNFRYKEDRVTAKATDGQSVTYEFSHGLLTCVKSSSKPEVEYKYCRIDNRKVLEKEKTT